MDPSTEVHQNRDPWKSPEDGLPLSSEERETLRQIVMESIQNGLSNGCAMEPGIEGVPPHLMEPGAVFVTLEKDGQLRGCVGSLEPKRSLINDVARNAYGAAFSDHRFSPLAAHELPGLQFHISLLTPMEPLAVKDRGDLVESLRPGRDGLLMEDPPHRSTFLPQVWDSLPDPRDFLGKLFLKAGLKKDHWSESIRFSRYSVEEF